MTISGSQRQQTEARIRAAADRLLGGNIPAGGKCDIKTLATAGGVSRAALYRTYPHLKHEFEQRLSQQQAAGQLPDPRDAQIARLKDDNANLRIRIAELNQQITDANAFHTTAISQLATQHDELQRQRQIAASRTNVVSLSTTRISPRPPASDPRRQRCGHTTIVYRLTTPLDEFDDFVPLPQWLHTATPESTTWLLQTVLALADAAQKIDWRGDMAHLPAVATNPQGDPVLIVKQHDDGATFMICDNPQPWIAEDHGGARSTEVTTRPIIAANPPSASEITEALDGGQHERTDSGGHAS